MTVKELIAKLSEFPPEQAVIVCGCDFSYFLNENDLSQGKIKLKNSGAAVPDNDAPEVVLIG